MPKADDVSSPKTQKLELATGHQNRSEEIPGPSPVEEDGCPPMITNKKPVREPPGETDMN